MALSKRHSRKITVDKADYRWTAKEINYYLDVTIQSASGKGQKISISIGLMWTSDPAYKDLQRHESITPVLVKDLIVSAIRLGWKPENNGKQIRASLLKSGLTFHT